MAGGALVYGRAARSAAIAGAAPSTTSATVPNRNFFITTLQSDGRTSVAALVIYVPVEVPEAAVELGSGRPRDGACIAIRDPKCRLPKATVRCEVGAIELRIC